MIVRIILIAIIGVILGILVKAQKPEYSVYITIGVSMLIFFSAVTMISSVKQQLSFLGVIMEGNEKYYGMMFKMMGITYLCEFCSGICKDSGYQAIGTQVEIFGKITILLSGLPILLTLIETIQNFAV
ncbi:MAG: SpoIIIAC/SpoIIIAD family protein [Lachnospiraceae bacterium]|nr:SpoIIIAC/SpoIIIAD family protein [Lachnospiraceae bacterium]